MSSHPTPRVGCAIVGLAIQVHDSRQSELVEEASVDLDVCAVRMRMAPIKLAGFFKNLKCNIRNIVLCPLNTG